MNKIVEVNQLTKTFPGKKGKVFTAVDHINFSLQEGEILGLLGPNGAGKTTTTQMLIGSLVPTSGDIFYFGKKFHGIEDPALNQMNFASAYSNIPGRLTIKENLIVFSHLYKIEKYQERIARLAKDFEVEDMLGKSVNSLSAGQKTRVMLMKAMINYPRLLLLDEPTASLDPDISLKVRQYLLAQREKYNVTILFTSHNMTEIEELCDRVIFLNHGKVVAEDTPAGITRKMRKTSIRLTILKNNEALITYAEKQHLDLAWKKETVIIELDEEQIPKVLYEISDSGVRYTNIEIIRPTLEDFFLQLRSKSLENVQPEELP